MHWGAMGARKTTGHLDGANGASGAEGAHADHHLAGEATGLPGVDVGLVHGDIETHVDISDPQAVLDQRLLEGEGAAEHERDQVVLPQRTQICYLLNQFSIPKDVVFGDISADIEILP